MRALLVVVGLVMVGVGAVWTLQGAGALHGSPMTGVGAWAVIGPVVAIVGLVLAGFAVRRR